MTLSYFKIKKSPYLSKVLAPSDARPSKNLILYKVVAWKGTFQAFVLCEIKVVAQANWHCHASEAAMILLKKAICLVGQTYL